MGRGENNLLYGDPLVQNGGDDSSEIEEMLLGKNIDNFYWQGIVHLNKQDDFSKFMKLFNHEDIEKRTIFRNNFVSAMNEPLFLDKLINNPDIMNFYLYNFHKNNLSITLNKLDDDIKKKYYSKRAETKITSDNLIRLIPLVKAVKRYSNGMVNRMKTSELTREEEVFLNVYDSLIVNNKVVQYQTIASLLDRKNGISGPGASLHFLSSNHTFCNKIATIDPSINQYSSQYSVHHLSIDEAVNLYNQKEDVSADNFILGHSSRPDNIDLCSDCIRDVVNNRHIIERVGGEINESLVGGDQKNNQKRSLKESPEHLRKNFPKDKIITSLFVAKEVSATLLYKAKNNELSEETLSQEVFRETVNCMLNNNVKTKEAIDISYRAYKDRNMDVDRRTYDEFLENTFISMSPEEIKESVNKLPTLRVSF